MGKVDLTDIVLTPLKQIEVSGGNVFHAMKSSDLGFAGFGEAYFSWISPGAIKGWKRHTLMTMNIVVPLGRVRFIFRSVNGGGNEEFRIEDVGVNRYARITVPPGIWFGFQNIGTSEGLVLNIANMPHDQDEIERLSLADVNFDWSVF